jgi:hypothetical protein
MFEALGKVASALKINRSQAQYLCMQSLLLHLAIERENSTRLVASQYVAAYAIFLFENKISIVKTANARDFATSERGQRVAREIKEKFDRKLQEKPWFTIDEVAALLGVRHSTVRAW